MKKEQHAAVLMGLLTFEQSKTVFQFLTFEEKKRVIALIAHAPYIEKEAALEAVSACLLLVSEQQVDATEDVQARLRTVADAKPKTLARYIASLVRENNSISI